MTMVFGFLCFIAYFIVCYLNAILMITIYRWNEKNIKKPWMLLFFQIISNLFLSLIGLVISMISPTKINTIFPIFENTHETKLNLTMCGAFVFLSLAIFVVRDRVRLNR